MARDNLGHYEILGPLGVGGMGEVYVARDPILGRKVAIKVLPVNLSQDREALTRFTQESRSASALNHPNIVTIYEVGADDGTPYIVMEHIEGRDLRSLINEGPLPNRKALDIAAQIADGLAAAHEQGIVHRDLKPENVMYTKDGYIKILDFGLAKVLRASADDDKTVELELPGTNPGTILGTVGYMSPEQATGRRLDFRSDQFALGAILYELATGRPAFEGETAIDTLSAILHEEPEPIREHNNRAPEPFCWIVERLLSKEPGERYASTRDLARELRTLRDKISSEPSSFDVPRPRRFRRRRRTMISIATTVLLTGGLAAAIWFARTHSSSAPTTPTKNYLAVLPFKNLTGDPGGGQLMVDGFAETLSARLARHPAVQVMRASRADASSGKRLPDLARELGANMVLSGSMQRDRERVRVNYSVFNAVTSTEQPGEVIDGLVNDIFAVQDKLADSVAVALKLTPMREVTTENVASQDRYLQAVGYLQRYDNEASVDGAIRILEDLRSHGGTSASVDAMLGRAYLYKYQVSHDPEWASKANEACNRAVATDPHKYEVHFTLGVLRRETGRLKEAIEELNEAVRQQPHSAEAILELAETYKAAGSLANAERAYREAISLNPNYWSGYNKLGAFYHANGRYPEAAELFKKVIALAPDNLRGYNNLGAVYLQMGRYADAVGVFSQSISHQPTTQGYSNLGTCYYFMGDYARAAQNYEKATALVPNKDLYWSNLGDAYRWLPGAKNRENAAYDRAIALAKRELEVNPRDGSVYARLALCYAKRGRKAEAQAAIDKALAIDPNNAKSIYHAAAIENLSGETAKAIVLLRRALAGGYSATEAQNDPDFRNLAKSDIFHKASS